MVQCDISLDGGVIRELTRLWTEICSIRNDHVINGAQAIGAGNAGPFPAWWRFTGANS